MNTSQLINEYHVTMSGKNRRILIIILAVIIIAAILYAQRGGFSIGMNDGANMKKKLDDSTVIK